MQDEDPLAEFTASIIEAAKASIPTTSTIPQHINKPWFDDNCTSTKTGFDKT